MDTEKRNVVIIQFKDPDLGGILSDAGVTSKDVRRLRRLAEFGEYWALELSMNTDGSVAAARFIRNRMA